MTDYAVKYSPVVDEKFKLLSVTESAINRDYDWVGAMTVAVYSSNTAGLTDYTKSGTSRYGTPTEIAGTKQEMPITQDKAFSCVIDKATQEGTNGALQDAGKQLARQIEEVVTPTVDAYRIGKMATATGVTTSKTGAPSKSDAYAKFLAGTEALGDAKVPTTGRVAFVSYSFFNLLKQDGSFVKASDLGQQIAINGAVGMIDGVAIIPVPSSYLPENVYMVMAHKSCTVAPVKLAEYKIHENPQGISGVLIEGRVMFDAYVLNSKAKGIFVGKSA